ncbi:MAG: hypothetical protein QOG87_3314 [Actinomycetota bacterium]|jgi:uncharacterized protein (TIGR03084 family)
MGDVLDDLEGEHAVLDALVSPLSDARWKTPTPAEGWDLADTIAHLTLSDEAALGAVAGDGEELFKGIMENPDAALAGQAEAVAELAPAQVLERWRAARSAVLAAMRAAPPRARAYWGIGEMSVRSLATARLMECWAHGLDCFAALGVEPVDTDRMRHVCYLGYQTLPYAFQFAEQDMPAARDQLRLELTGPSGDTWTFGPDDAPQVVRGAAGEWARLAVRRISLADAPTLRADGPLAEAALHVAKAYLL